MLGLRHTGPVRSFSVFALFIVSFLVIGCSAEVSGSTSVKAETETTPAPKAEEPKTEEAKPAEAAAPGFSNVVISDTKGVKTNKPVLSPSTEEIFVYFSFNAKVGQKLMATLYLDKSEEKKYEGKVKDSEIEVPEGHLGTADFTFTKPSIGWPVGEYRVELTVDGETPSTINFKVE